MYLTDVSKRPSRNALQSSHAFMRSETNPMAEIPAILSTGTIFAIWRFYIYLAMFRISIIFTQQVLEYPKVSLPIFSTLMYEYFFFQCCKENTQVAHN